MPKRYSRILRDAMADRAIEVETELLSSDPHYQELNNKICDLLDKIERHLPSEMQQLIYDLDGLMVEEGALAYRVMYKQGLIDRFNLD